MDMKIDDVVQILGVPKTTIEEWLTKGEIPSYQIQEEIRFDRSEIEAWMMERDEWMKQIRHDLDHQTGLHTFSLFRAFHKGDVLISYESSKEEVICETVKTIADKLGLEAKVLRELVLDRERLAPTALGHGVAVPHARDFLLEQRCNSVTLTICNEPIEYEALDGQKVDILFFLFACENKSHLNLLAKIAHFANQEKNRDFLRTKPEKEDLLNYIKKWESGLKKQDSI